MSKKEPGIRTIIGRILIYKERRGYGHGRGKGWKTVEDNRGAKKLMGKSDYWCIYKIIKERG